MLAEETSVSFMLAATQRLGLKVLPLLVMTRLLAKVPAMMLLRKRNSSSLARASEAEPST